MSSHNRPQHKDRKYSDLTMKQKGRIAEKTYEKHLRFYLEKGRMPDVEEGWNLQTALSVCKRTCADGILRRIRCPGPETVRAV